VVDKQQLQSLAQDTFQAFAPVYREAMHKAIQDSGAPDNWFALSLAHGSEPEPFTVDHFHALAPYTSKERQKEVLENLAQLELLKGAGEDAYQLTDQGRKAVEGIFGAAHEKLGQVEPLPADKMDQLNGLLYRLVKATLKAPEPKDKWAMAYSRWTDPGESAARAVKTDQYLTDLLRFRDDAHVAAWKPHNISGQAWETLTFIWRGEASSAEELADRLPFRSYTAQDYEEALQDLTSRGWIVEEAGAHKLTEKGKQVREEAEEATDRHFFVGWSALSQDELAQLGDLLAQAKETLQTTTLAQLWTLAGETSQAIFAVTRDTVDPLLEKHGLNERGFAFTLLSAQSFEPEPVSAARLSIRSPYTNPAQYDSFLTKVAEAGFLEPKGDGEYKLTEKARTVLHELNDAFYTRLGEIPALPDENLARSEDLLKRVVDACLEAPEPASKWCISKSHQGHPSQEYAPLAKIDQHLDDLNAFRDDAHLAAWQPYDVSGHAWEALTLIWRGDARTAEEMAERPFRGHSAETYSEALADLTGRGWVEQTSDGYRVTEKGQALRQEAEEATDRYFFAPWARLSVTEKVQLHWLLTQLKNNLQEMVENEGDAA
jgi:Mn-dependent DtxR family transcriptional regulator